MTAETPVAQDDPLMIAWNAYKETKGFANTKRWATNTAHVDGSLWAAFMSGYNAVKQK